LSKKRIGAAKEKKSLNCPRLIEVALPIREISAESVRDKSLRHGHISTLHLWWARRPLAASRGIVFASLVPDPDDPHCPTEFRKAVERLLRNKLPTALRAYRRGREWIPDGDPYRPYDGIPDTPRNRLLTFIAKWSPEKLAFDAGKNGNQPKPAELLDDRSLVKWETSDSKNPQGSEVLRIARELVTIANNGETPTVLDPFAGGGAIPLEAARLGCQGIANDYNPVAYLILRATCEFPQKYGERLVRDVGHWTKWILERVRQRIGHLYPPGNDGRPVVGYLWARTAPCPNPACRATISLLRSLVVCDLRNRAKRVGLKMTVDRAKKEIQFGIVRGSQIRDEAGTMIEKGRGDARCPFCQQVVSVKDLKEACGRGQFGERIVAVIVEGKEGKDYRSVEPTDLSAFHAATKLAEKLERPTEPMPVTYTQAFPSCTWGFHHWGSLFNDRQIVALHAFVDAIHEALEKVEGENGSTEYAAALAGYLGLYLDRVAQRGSNMGLWHTGQETFEHPFGRQAIPLVWDYPEANPFSSFVQKTISASYLTEVISREGSSTGRPARVFLGDAAKLALETKANLVVTDPPYFDAISYADLADYFYVWLKRSIWKYFPEAFSTPLTPKRDEATSLKHRHDGDGSAADNHFEKKLTAALRQGRERIEGGGPIVVMFAHQSTKAWTALINSVFDAGLNITATWPLDTEKTYALKSEKSVLSSSITVICQPRTVGAIAALKDVRREIHEVVRESVHRFWNYGFRGADLIVACYGPAVGVFGQYGRVERAEGTLVGVPELLELARESALKAIAGEFQGDELSRLYFVWANQYGVAPQSFDDLVKVAQMGVEDEDAATIARQRGLFVVDGPTCRLALLSDRADRKHLGEETAAPLIDKLHHTLHLWKAERRTDLVNYVAQQELIDEPAFWKLAQALFEVLPRGDEDWKLVSALLSERESLQTEAKRASVSREGRLL
jgi:putative DNA methylase